MGSENTSGTWSERQALFSWWLFLAACAVVARSLSPGVLEGGDGIQHFQIARYSWQHPILFLHHWGKPVFTLLSSPFAQWGLWGMTVFNALCFVVACWAADAFLKEGPRVVRWAFAPLLLLVPVYGTMVLAGMTEVLFGTMALLVLQALWSKRFSLALGVASFLPFVRPESVVFIPMVLLWVIAHRGWRSLPWVFTGHLVYGIIGAFALGDALWAFHQDPYTGASAIYGHGDPWHFVREAPVTYGTWLLWLVGISLPLTVLGLVQRGTRTRAVFMGYLALLPSLAVLALHSYLWWQGLKGSLGLTRVLATTAPLLVLFVCWSVGTLVLRSKGPSWLQWSLSIAGVVALIWWACADFLAVRPLPVESIAYERFVADAGKRADALAGPNGRLVYFHPGIAFHAGRDPYNDSTSAIASAALLQDQGLRDGDVIAWDAHFGPNEGGVALERLLGDTSLELLSVMAPEERMVVLGGRPFEVYIFRKGGGTERRSESFVIWPTSEDFRPRTLRTDTVRCGGSSMLCLGGTEFPFAMEDLPLTTGGALYTELRIRGSVRTTDEQLGELNLVFTEENDQGKVSYWSERLRSGPFDLRFSVPPRSCDVRNKFYLWHLQRSPVELDSLRIDAVRLARAS